MRIIEKTGWKGLVDIRVIDRSKKTVKNFHVNNMITNNGLDELLKAFYVLYPDIYLKHVAIGTDNTAVAATDETLGVEVYRFPVVTRLRTGTGELQSASVLLAEEPTALSGAVGIKEVGFFVGSESEDWNGGDGKDTGLLLSRVLWDYSKIATEEIQFVRTDEISRA